MITINGYSKTDQPAEGIAVTWSKDLIEMRGGLLSFIRYFEKVMSSEENLWLQKCKNPPKQPIAFVYIIVCNQVRYRLNYVGWETGEANITYGNGYSWSRSNVIGWPRLVLSGPFVKAPSKIIRPGFQGFRYTSKLF